MSENSQSNFPYQLDDLNFCSFDDRGGYKIDLPTIPKQIFIKLLKTIAFFSLSDITTLMFCNSLKDFPEKRAIPKTSIITRLKYAEKTIVSTLNFIIPHSISLESLSLKGLDLSSPAIDSISESLKHSSHLKNLMFEKIPFTTENIQIMLKSIDSLSLEKLSFIDCSLSDDCISLFMKLFKKSKDERKGGSQSYRSKRNIAQSLLELNLSKNTFSFNFVLAIEKILSEISLNVLDLRENQTINPKLIQNVAHQFPKVTILVNNTQCCPTLHQLYKERYEIFKGIYISGENAQFFVNYVGDMLEKVSHYGDDYRIQHAKFTKYGKPKIRNRK